MIWEMVFYLAWIGFIYGCIAFIFHVMTFNKPHEIMPLIENNARDLVIRGDRRK